MFSLLIVTVVMSVVGVFVSFFVSLSFDLVAFQKEKKTAHRSRSHGKESLFEQSKISIDNILLESFLVFQIFVVYFYGNCAFPNMYACALPFGEVRLFA